jgi:hypothetical protein
MHQRFRRDQEHDHGRHRERAEGDRAAIDHDRNQHDGRHEERSLGCDFRAREQEVKGGGDQRHGCRPFLDRKCQWAGR